MNIKPILLLMLFGTNAQAAKMTVTETVCPYGDDGVRIYKLVSDNKTGGYDSDLASYSSGQQFRSVAISTCYDNLFSFYGKDLKLKISKEQKPKIAKSIHQIQKTFSDPKNPMVWERYAIANAMYAILGKPAYQRAHIMLEASWTIRDAIVGFHRGLNGPNAVKQVIDLGPKELKKDLNPDQRKLLLFNLARVAHRGGYNQWRDHYFNQFMALPNLSSADKQSAAMFQKHAIILEPSFQKKALTLFKASLNERLSKPQRERALFLISELNRRLGNQKEALKGFQHISKSGKDKQLKEISVFFLKNDLRMKPNQK